MPREEFFGKFIIRVVVIYNLFPNPLKLLLRSLPLFEIIETRGCRNFCKTSEELEKE